MKSKIKVLKNIDPIKIKKEYLVRSINTSAIKNFDYKHIFDSHWSFDRGYRFNYKKTNPTLYFAANQTVASTEIGPRTYSELIHPYAFPYPPMLYFSVEVTANVLDLTDILILSKLGMNESDINITTDEWEEKMDNDVMAITHIIGEATLKDNRFDGILYRPYPMTLYGISHNYRNCAIFMDKKSKYMSKPKNKSVILKVIDNDNVLKKFGISIT